MTSLELIGHILVCVGMPFFLSGTIGLLRFPDVYTRLHALTKADNVGLFLIAAGLALQAESAFAAAKLLLIWLLVVVASSASCHLVARIARQRGVQLWKQP